MRGGDRSPLARDLPKRCGYPTVLLFRQGIWGSVAALALRRLAVRRR